MKIRNGLVSNSSSSSFVIRKDHLTTIQIYLIENHAKLGKLSGSSAAEMLKNILEMGSCDFAIDEYDAWSIYDECGKIRGYTSMDNFDMEEFLKSIGVEEDYIEWGK